MLLKLSVVESTEETLKGIRSKETKSGRSRTVALPGMVVDELDAPVSHGLKSF
jgi:hypothetical protein